MCQLGDALRARAVRPAGVAVVASYSGDASRRVP
jgi:hypothetical protein